MNGRLFEVFATMINSFPPKAVLRTVARERHMLEEDLASGRTQPNGDIAAILNFCRFLEGAVLGSSALPHTIPMEHWTFYVKTVERLVAAAELPPNVKTDIETAFQNIFRCIMASKIDCSRLPKVIGETFRQIDSKR